MIPVLALVGLAVVPLILNFSGPTATSDGLVVTGIAGIVVGLIGLGMTPRRASTVYLDRAGLYKRPSLSGGVIALSILFASLVVLAIGAILSSM